MLCYRHRWERPLLWAHELLRASAGTRERLRVGQRGHWMRWGWEMGGWYREMSGCLPLLLVRLSHSGRDI